MISGLLGLMMFGAMLQPQTSRLPNEGPQSNTGTAERCRVTGVVVDSSVENAGKMPTLPVPREAFIATSTLHSL
jgi:hypothetical protein